MVKYALMELDGIPVISRLATDGKRWQILYLELNPLQASMLLNYEEKVQYDIAVQNALHHTWCAIYDAPKPTKRGS